MPARRSASLQKRHPRRFDIPLLLVISAVLIGMGLLTPAVETRVLVWRNEYPILSNIHQMSKEGRHTAATILTICSVIYPGAKIGMLTFFWLFPFPANWRWRSIQLIRLLGRWGMVDVFTITSIVLASLTIGPLQAKPKAGLFLFASGMMCLMFVGLLMDRLARTKR